jgi:hypothetical protein
MDRSRREDRKLKEVKGLLERLQELPAGRQSADSRPAERGFRRGYLVGIASTTTVMVTAAVVLAFGFGYVLTGFEPQALSTLKDGPSRQLASSKVPDASDVAAGSAVSPAERPGAQTTVSPPVKVPDASDVVAGSALSPAERPGAPTTIHPAVEAAQALMSTGRVQAARQQLLAMASDGSPTVAWALARSYDPNHLKGIEGADAGPDVAEATRWYRTWHAGAVKQGMIADSVSLEKIIGSMRP